MKLIEKIVMTSMNFTTLPYDHVTNSFLLEICFWGPTYPTFLYDVTLFSLFRCDSISRPDLWEVLESIVLKLINFGDFEVFTVRPTKDQQNTNRIPIEYQLKTNWRTIDWVKKCQGDYQKSPLGEYRKPRFETKGDL